jgi:hypothetical protein
MQAIDNEGRMPRRSRDAASSEIEMSCAPAMLAILITGRRDPKPAKTSSTRARP